MRDLAVGFAPLRGNFSFLSNVPSILLLPGLNERSRLAHVGRAALVVRLEDGVAKIEAVPRRVGQGTDKRDWTFSVEAVEAQHRYRATSRD